MITNGWLDWAIRLPGPANKTYAEQNKRVGLALHSMEGWLAGSLRELEKPERQASWTFSLGLDGNLYQHYPLSACVWASGNYKANTEYPAMELEGTADMPMNPAQLETALRLVREIGCTEPGKTLREHRTLWNIDTPNAGPTACPSERYAPLYAALKEDDVTEERVKELIKEAFDAGYNSGALASTTDVLSCLAQITGVEPNTYSDRATVEAVRKALGVKA